MEDDTRICINCYIELPADAYSVYYSVCCKQCGIDLRRELDNYRGTI